MQPFFQVSDASEGDMEVTRGLRDGANGPQNDDSDGDERETARAAEAANNGVFHLMMDKFHQITQERKKVRLEELKERFQSDLKVDQVPLQMAVEKLRAALIGSIDPEKKSKIEKELSVKLKTLDELVKDITAKYTSDKAIAQRSCLTLDGETSHCDYFFNPQTKAPTEALARWESTNDQALKLFRGTSLKYQVLDQSLSFPDMHTAFKEVSDEVYRWKNPPAPDARVENFIKRYSPPSQLLRTHRVLRAHAIPGTQSSPLPRYIEHTEMSAAVKKTFTSYLRAAPSIIKEVFNGQKATKVFQDTSCYPFTDSVINCELHIRHCLGRSMTQFFKNMVPNSLI